MKALLGGLAIFLVLLAATVYFVRVLWPLLPPWLALIGFMVLAVLLIGAPIYSLWRWSEQRLEQRRASGHKPRYDPHAYDDKDRDD
jgi:membrane protein implicated in regulation of membrane protease activity